MLLSVNETRPRLHSTLTPLDLIGTDHFATTPPGRHCSPSVVGRGRLVAPQAALSSGSVSTSPVPSR